MTDPVTPHDVRVLIVLAACAWTMAILLTAAAVDAWIRLVTR